MTRDEFRKWAEAHGYRDNGRGSDRFVKTMPDGRRECYKINAIKVRHEREFVYEAGNCAWIRIRSGFLSRIQADITGVLYGLSR